ncbi:MULTISPECIES: restriction endonuclease [unclassified Streptomyces]|uniref:restriction endonuclease n=1 Tax=unclassified Streptomyces TaxID=2593676 RepID=UPI00224D4E01|nr:MULTISPECIES: restriction endonuclease [unclassified Streptomyces]MCX5123566.1 restriction endonuclease [Streptomyces sp. NBC_00347]MCX5405659.1 restriction endonuclease [Streptomyces sp. NBC_00086]
MRAALVVGGVGVVLLAVFWAEIWPYAAGAVGATVAGAGGWRLWRTDRVIRRGDRQWRHEEAVKAGHRTLAEVDSMTGGEFEDFVLELCRRDGCTELKRVGGSHDDGADVRGRLPDGRSMVIQCKRYAPKRTIPSREVRDLLGARVHFAADVAIFVTTTYFSGPSVRTAVKNGVLAIHRDHLGLWNNGTSVLSLSNVNGSGQGDRQHRARRKETYG